MTASAARPLRVLWLIKGLGPGGAERLLVEHRGRVNYVAVTGASNVTGILNPVREHQPMLPARGEDVKRPVRKLHNV